MAIHAILNPILNPLLVLHPFIIILIISFFVSLLTTLIYKWTTNQILLKEIKSETKKLQNRLKLVSKQPEKAMAIQQEMMKLNMEYMKSSFKPMIFTFIPIILFFGWLGANMAFNPILPNQEFSINVTLNNITGDVSLIFPEGIFMKDDVTKKAELNVEWKNIKGSEGEYDFKLVHEASEEEFVFNVIISDNQEYATPLIQTKSEVFNRIIINQNKLLVFEDISVFKSIPWISGFGWLGSYILFSLLFSTLLRKIMKLS
jgi:uncharacterized membrane protein (DUF106 family)